MRKFPLLIIIGLFLSLSFISPANATEQKYKESIGFDYNYIEAYDLKNTNGNNRLYKKNLANYERASQPAIHYDSKMDSHYMCDWQYNKVLDRWVCGKDYMKAYEYTHPTPIQACPFGYELNYSRTGCNKIAVPANAHLNSYGNGWECKPGFHKSYTGTSCLSDKYAYDACGSTCTGCSGSYQKSQPAKTLAQQTFPYQTSQTQIIYHPQTITVVPVAYPVKYVNINAYADNIETPTVLAKTGPSTIWLLAFGFLGFIIVSMCAISIK